MVNFKTLSAIFVTVAIIFAASTGYLAAFPPSSSTHTSTQTMFVTSTALSIILTTITGSGAITTITESAITTTVTAPILTTTISTVSTAAPSTSSSTSTSTKSSSTSSATMSSSSASSTSSTMSTTSSSTSSGASVAVVNVAIPPGASTQGNLAFSPDTITVVIGVNNTVMWTNDDSTTHTVTSMSVPAGAQSFGSNGLNPQNTFTWTFTVAGTYQYYCEIHPWMQGTVVVEP